MSGYESAHLSDIGELDDGRCPFRPVRVHLGITSFGITAWTGRNVGDRILNEHDESDPDSSEELYLVLQGRAVFELDGERRDAPAGTFVVVRPGVTRTAFAQEPDTTIVAVSAAGGAPGWEVFAPVRRLYEAGEYAEAADLGRELLAVHPDQAGLFYNVACTESLAGRPGDALDHLTRAIELSESLRPMAAEDSDFDAIRDEPGFRDLVAG